MEQTGTQKKYSLGAFVRSRLWLRLTVAFALIILIGIAVTVLLARSGAATQFEHFMVQGRMVRPGDGADARRRGLRWGHEWHDGQHDRHA